MNENPYSKILELMKTPGGSSSNFVLGEIASSSPLAVRVGELQLSRSDLLIAENLVGNLRSGNLVALHPINDNQAYVILAKVVRA